MHMMHMRQSIGSSATEVRCHRPPITSLTQRATLVRFRSTHVTFSNNDVSSSSSSTSDSTGSAAGEDKVMMMTKIKSFGIAGTLSYVITELVFWAVALPGAWIGG